MLAPMNRKLRRISGTLGSPLVAIHRLVNHMRVWLLLSALALLGMSCVPEYDEVGQGDLIAMDMWAEVESITVDFKNLRELEVHVNNRGDRIEFPVFAMWVSKTLEPGVTGIPFDSGYLCMQYHPIVGDSLFKKKGSRKIKVHIRKTRSIDSILIVDRELMERTLEMEFRSPAGEGRF